MPQQPRDQSSQTEGRIALAIQAFKQGQFKSLRAATETYNVPYSTTRDCLNRHLMRRDLRPINLKLIAIKELMLIK
jgi:hypothetical protein